MVKAYYSQHKQCFVIVISQFVSLYSHTHNKHCERKFYRNHIIKSNKTERNRFFLFFSSVEKRFFVLIFYFKPFPNNAILSAHITHTHTHTMVWNSLSLLILLECVVYHFVYAFNIRAVGSRTFTKLDFSFSLWSYTFSPSKAEEEKLCSSSSFRSKYTWILFFIRKTTKKLYIFHLWRLMFIVPTFTQKSHRTLEKKMIFLSFCDCIWFFCFSFTSPFRSSSFRFMLCCFVLCVMFLYALIFFFHVVREYTHGWLCLSLFFSSCEPFEIWHWTKIQLSTKLLSMLFIDSFSLVVSFALWFVSLWSLSARRTHTLTHAHSHAIHSYTHAHM